MIPNAITSMNLLCGVLGVIAALRGHVDYAFLLMLLASVFDFMDGLAARILKAYSEIGKQLDSLSDMVSFGVLPAIMMFATANRCNCPIEFVPLLFAVFAALRLAKFNIDERQHSSFIGLPSPAAAIIAGSLCHFMSTSNICYFVPLLKAPWFMPLVAVILGVLMVCNIPMFALKLGGGDKADKKTAIKRIAFLVALVIIAAVVLLTGIVWSAIPLLGFSFYILLNIVIR